MNVSSQLAIMMSIVLYMGAMPLYAQTPAIDSLFNVLTTSKEDTNKVITLITLSNELANKSEYDKLHPYADTALALSIKLNYKMGIGRSYVGKGIAFMLTGDQPEAVKHLQMAIKILEPLGDKAKIVGVYVNIGLAYRNMGNYPEALKYYLKSLEIAESLGDQFMIGSTCLNVSALYAYQHQYEEALKYNSITLEAFKTVGNRDKMALAYNNQAMLYSNLNRFQEALENMQQALKINEALDRTERVAANYGNLGQIYGNLGNFEEGLKYAQMAIQIFEKSGKDKKGLASSYINAGAALSRLAAVESDQKESERKYDLALKYFNSALQLSTDLSQKEKIMNSYNGLYTLYQDRGNFELALENYKQYTLYKDSLFNEQSSRQTEQLKIQYETAKKDRELELKEAKLQRQQAMLHASAIEAEKKQNEIVLLNMNSEVRELQLTDAERKFAQQQAEARARAAELNVLKKDRELQAQELTRQKLLRNGLLAGSLLLLIAGIFVFRTVQLRRQLEKQQAVAEERRRIGADLHDEIGSALSSINILSGLAGDKMATDREAAREIIGRINHDAKRTHESMYDIIWEVKPENDSLEKVVTRMRQYASELLEARNIHLRFPRNEDLKTIDLDPVKRHALYLIFKESINNIAKYSGAGEAVVSLTRDNGALKLSVTDNGTGFNPESGNQGNGIGNMKQRSMMIGADFDLKSSPGQGTAVKLSIPV